MDFKVEPVHHHDASHSDGEITTNYGDLTGTEVTKSNSAMTQPGLYNTNDNPSKIPAVTVEDAIQGLITVIHYLQAHPPDQDIQILFEFLDYINKQASHVSVKMAYSNDQTNDIHNLQLNKTLTTNNIKIEPITMMGSAEEMHDSSDITPLEHGTPNVRFTRQASQKDVNNSIIFATHDAIPEQLEPDVLISNKNEITVENRRKLFDHSKGHRKYNCKECGRSSTSKAGLVRHMLRHRNKKLQESDVGDIVNNTKKTSSLYQCKSCDFQCEERKELWDHSLSHSEYVCKECGRKCRHKSALAKHMKIHERKVSLSKSKSTSSMPPKDMFYIDENMQIYKCKLCDYHCVNKRKIHYHAESHRDYKCKVCGKKSTCKDALAKHMTLHDKKQLLPCQYCKQGFEEAEQLMEHLKIHSGKSIASLLTEKCVVSVAYR